MAYLCFGCGKEQELIDGRPGRKETCPNCDADLHACRNCKFYDPSAYNGCAEPNAERVVDKERSNFCDYFSFADNRKGGSSRKKDEKAEARKRLDDLFK